MNKVEFGTSPPALAPNHSYKPEDIIDDDNRGAFYKSDRRLKGDALKMPVVAAAVIPV